MLRVFSLGEACSMEFSRRIIMAAGTCRSISSMAPSGQMHSRLLRDPASCHVVLQSADCKRGRRKGATSKIVKKCQKVFRQVSRRAKKLQESSKSVKKFSDTFRQVLRRPPFYRPLVGGSDTGVSGRFGREGVRKSLETCPSKALGRQSAWYGTGPSRTSKKEWPKSRTWPMAQTREKIVK